MNFDDLTIGFKNALGGRLAFFALAAVLVCALALLASCSSSAQQSQNASADAAQGSEVVVGVAWRPNMESQSFKATCLALEEAGIRYVVLDQALSADLRYDGQNKLLEGVAETRALTPEAAKLVRCNTWQGSNAHSVLDVCRSYRRSHTTTPRITWPSESQPMLIPFCDSTFLCTPAAWGDVLESPCVQSRKSVKTSERRMGVGNREAARDRCFRFIDPNQQGVRRRIELWENRKTSSRTMRSWALMSWT